MIQRIQSVYLALSAILLGLMFFFPIAEIKGDSLLYEFSAFGFAPLSENSDLPAVVMLANIIPIYVWIGIIITFIFISIGLYKKRKVQLKLNRLIFLLTLGLIVYIYFEADKAVEFFNSSQNPLYKASIYFAVASLPLLFLANRGIKKDEDLVKSLDRIR